MFTVVTVTVSNSRAVMRVAVTVWAQCWGFYIYFFFAGSHLRKIGFFRLELITLEHISPTGLTAVDNKKCLVVTAVVRFCHFSHVLFTSAAVVQWSSLAFSLLCRWPRHFPIYQRCMCNPPRLTVAKRTTKFGGSAFPQCEERVPTLA